MLHISALEPWLVPAVMAAVVLSVLVLWIAAVIKRRRIESRIRHNEDFRLRQDASYVSAKKDLEKVAAKLSERLNGAMIVDLIHDFGEYPFLHPELFERENTPDSITFEQAFDVMNKVRSAKKRSPIAVILHTPGGYSLATEFVAAALSRHSGDVLAFVPYIAMSGGTIVALASSEIHLGPNAALGPIDTQYGLFPFDAYRKLFDLKNAQIDDFYALRYYQAEMREQGVRTRLKSVARQHNRSAVEKLLDSHLPHDWRITVDEAPKYDLKISESEFPKDIYRYVELRLIMLRRYKELMTRDLRKQLAETGESSKEEDKSGSGGDLRRVA